MVRLHIKPSLGHIKRSELRQNLVQGMLTDKHASGLSPGTVC